jgi:hypothetical protein
MMPIKIEFIPTALGRIDFRADVMTANKLSLKPITFKLDTASDFTTLSCEDLFKLGYTESQLQACPVHEGGADTGGGNLPLRYLTNVSIKFGDREIQGARVFFALGTKLRSLFGCDILKYFNFSVDYDKGEFMMNPVTKKPGLTAGESSVHIYSLGKN